MSYYGTKAIDFHHGLASDKDSILYRYSAGDGIHVNDRGHAKLYNRVIKESIPDSLCAIEPFVPVAENLMTKPKLISVATY